MLLERMTAAEWEETRAYYEIEPYGEIREELRHGSWMAMYANCKRDSRSKPEPFTALDFMHYTEHPEEREVPEEDPDVLSAEIAQGLFSI